MPSKECKLSFMEYDLGFFDEEVGRVEPTSNPLFTETVNHVSGIRCKPCVRNTPFINGAPGRIRTSDPLVRSQVLYPTELRARC